MIEIITTLGLLFSATVTYAKEIEITPIETKPKTTEQIVRESFQETPDLISVAFCESTFRHTDERGEVLRGIKNKGDIGVMQINIYYHKERAESLGFDLYAIDGNIGYAKWLYEKEGLKPWSSSAKCWRKIQNQVVQS